MDMNIIYQFTFYLALSLLAIIITVFVFAVSLLGRAMEAAARSQEQKISERKAINAKEIEELREEMGKPGPDGQIPHGLTEKLKNLEKQDKKFQKELDQIKSAPSLLTVKGGLLPPSKLFLAAMVLSSLASGLSGLKNALIPLTSWALSMAAVGTGVWKVCCSLKVIEEVAITSEEAGHRKAIDALKTALLEVEEEKRPQLQFTFRGEQPPFSVKTGS